MTSFGVTKTVSLADIGGAVLKGSLSLQDIRDGLSPKTTRGDITLRSQKSNGDFSARSTVGAFLIPSEKSFTQRSRSNKKRKGTTERRPGFGDGLDDLTDNLIGQIIEPPACVRVWQNSEYCQRFCYPADYATKGAMQKEDQDGEASTNEYNFGLVQFQKSGYSILEAEEVSWHDMLVPRLLGFRVAIHRKTSTKRYCVTHEKCNLPGGIGGTHLNKMLKLLRRCEHVNVLCCYDVFEDETHLYLMYEFYPCVTLQSVLDIGIPLTQEQCVNIARECFAATAFAASLGLAHLGWTLCHVLLPASAVAGDPTCAKVFGFGLMGVVDVDSINHLCWSPEALETYNKTTEKSGNWSSKLQTSSRCFSDSWSLGCITYATVHRAAPFQSDMEVLRKEWTFTLVFDELDKEAKFLIEGLLLSTADKRIRPEKAVQHQWVRRRWRPPLGGVELFHKVDEFCTSALAKRLFGRFLIKFLDADHFRNIAHYFSMLDTSGQGFLTLKDLQFQAKLCGLPLSSASRIFEWLCTSGCDHISSRKFSEALAEYVADGPSLRLAFEILDDDGSEEVSPVELHKVLRMMDPSLTFEDVQTHIKSVELAMKDLLAKEDNDAGDADSQDHGTSDGVLSYFEFINLFPERTARMHKMSNRLRKSREECSSAAHRWDESVADVKQWLKALGQEKHALERLQVSMADRHEQQASAQNMRKPFARVKELLSNPPGARMEDDFGKIWEKGGKTKEFSWSPETFICDQAAREKWKESIAGDLKQLKLALQGKNPLTGGVDTLVASETCTSLLEKVKKVWVWCSSLFEEYNGFAEANRTPEVSLPIIPFSSRGSRNRGDCEDEGQEVQMDGQGAD